MVPLQSYDGTGSETMRCVFMDDAINAVRQSLKSGKDDPREWSGRCFGATNAASQALISIGSSHEIVVGNIYLSERPLLHGHP